MPQKTLGIDISDNGVSTLLLEGGISGYHVGGYKFIPYSGGVPDAAAVSEALNTAVAGLPAAGVRCAAAIPARRVFFRNLRLPPFDPKKIRPVLLFELEPLLPFSAEELITDFEIFSNPQHPDQVDVVTATIEKAELTRWMEIFGAARVELETLTFRGYALARCLVEMTAVPENWMLVDVDQAHVTLFAFTAGQWVFSRCAVLPFQKTRFEEALVTVIKQTIWAVEAVLTVDYRPETLHIDFNAENTDPARFRGLEARLHIPAEPADLAGRLQSKKNFLADLPEAPSKANAALSLALMKNRQLREIHFLQGAFSPKTQFTEYRTDFLKIALTLLVVIILGGVYFFMDMRLMEKKVFQLNASMKQAFQTAFPEEKVIVDPVRQMEAKLEDLKKRPLFTGDTGRWVKRIDLLKEISLQVPAQMDVDISRMTAGNEELILTGNTDTFNTVNTMKRRIEGSALFKEVTISSANLNRSGNRVDFILTIRF